MNWNYESDDYKENTFKVLPEGDYRVRIEDVEEQTFKSGNEGLKITMSVSGSNTTLWHYIVFMTHNKEFTNQKIGELLDSFAIDKSDFGNLQVWRGKVGAAKIVHEEYNGYTNPKIKYLIKRKDQDNLPAWVEPNKFAEKKEDSNITEFVDFNSDDLPFN